MIRNVEPRLNLLISFLVALLFHVVVLYTVKKKPDDFSLPMPLSRPIRIDRIQFIKPEEVERFRRVGIKNGDKSEFFRPDEIKIPRPVPPAQKNQLTLGNLAPDLPLPIETKKKKQKGHSNEVKVAANDFNETVLKPVQDGTGNIFFNPKKEKRIRRDREQDLLKQEVYNNAPASASSPIAQKMSNFEIRYERPEGVSEDELNSDEKAYYSFFKRSYANYLAKLYATYDRVVIERPGIQRDFNNKHVLLARIDYDAQGNIITVKILKSSESDDIHYFFEETLKQLNLPNPPASFIKNKKTFTTYYQIQIN